jgi:hypothetical protein
MATLTANPAPVPLTQPDTSSAKASPAPEPESAPVAGPSKQPAATVVKEERTGKSFLLFACFPTAESSVLDSDLRTRRPLMAPSPSPFCSLPLLGGTNHLSPLEMGDGYLQHMVTDDSCCDSLLLLVVEHHH